MSRRHRVEGGGGRELIFYQLVFVLVQYCVRVSASRIEVLTRKSFGGMRNVGNILRILADPAHS